MPKVSIIVPIYNVAPYLSKCIDSILGQSFEDFECILVNDGSTDNSGEICDKYSKADNRIKVIHKENGGLSSARNAGLDVATGDYIGFIDSDDYIHRDFISILLNAMLTYNTEVSVCEFLDVSDDDDFSVTKTDITCPPPRICPIKEAFSDNEIWHHIDSVCNKLFRRDLFDNARFPCGLINEDTYIKPEIYSKVTSIAFIDYPLYYYYHSPNSILRSDFSLKKLDLIVATAHNIDFFLKIKEPQALENELIHLFRYYFLYVFKALAITDKENGKLITKKYKKIYNKYFIHLLLSKRFTLKNKYMFIIYFLFPNFAEKRYGDSFRN